MPTGAWCALGLGWVGVLTQIPQVALFTDMETGFYDNFDYLYKFAEPPVTSFVTPIAPCYSVSCKPGQCYSPLCRHSSWRVRPVEATSFHLILKLFGLIEGGSVVLRDALSLATHASAELVDGLDQLKRPPPATSTLSSRR